MSEQDTKVLTGDELYEKYKIYDVDYASIGTNSQLTKDQKETQIKQKEHEEYKKYVRIQQNADARKADVKSYVESVIAKFKKSDISTEDKVLDILQVTEDEDPKITIDKLTFLLGFFTYMYNLGIDHNIYDRDYEPVVKAISKIRISIANKSKLTENDKIDILGDQRYLTPTHLLLPELKRGGSKSRRIRRRKHNRKTHHKRASKTHKRRRHSRSVRKHKKHTSRR
jgi:hypothetical protein